MTPFLPPIPRPGSIEQSLYPPTSRYYGLPVQTLTQPDGTEIAYLARRFVPGPDRFATLREHVVVDGERIDNIAARYLGDPEQFWRLCDANGVLSPGEMTETPGRRIRVTLPEGIPAITHA